MDRSAQSVRQEQIEAERKLLSALCQPSLEPHARAGILRHLENHAFAEFDHQIIYRALAVMPASELADVRAALARAVTRLGFPDLEMDWLFSGGALTPAEVDTLLFQLKKRF
jgi:hypothetical protein